MNAHWLIEMDSKPQSTALTVYLYSIALIY